MVRSQDGVYLSRKFVALMVTRVSFVPECHAVSL
jgi:hypothetical protein